jgi:nucleoside-diphosphate-sugar epimerase
VTTAGSARRRVLVTGGAGYIGSIVSRLLLERGDAVRVYDSLLHGGDALLSLYPFDGFEFVRGDIRAAEDLERALDGVDAVVHLAAIVGDPACSRDPELAREVNLEASLQLFDLCAKHGVERVVFASTCSNYGRMVDEDGYVTEETELRPLSVYAETKVAVERRLLGSNGSAPAATVLRFATIFGLSPRPRFDLTVNEFSAELLTRRRIVVFGEQFWRPYVHVADAARAVALVLDAPVATVGGAVFNVGATSENYRKGDVVELVQRELDGVDLEIEHVEQLDDPRDYRVSFAKFEQAFDFTPSRTVPDGIREVIQAVRSGAVGDPQDPRYRN